MYAKLREGLDKNIALCVFLVELMSYPHMQHEILISIPFLTFATMASSLVNVALQRVYEHEKDQVEHYFESMYANGLSAKSLISDAWEPVAYH